MHVAAVVGLVFVYFLRTFLAKSGSLSKFTPYQLRDASTSSTCSFSEEKLLFLLPHSLLERLVVISGFWSPPLSCSLFIDLKWPRLPTRLRRDSKAISTSWTFFFCSKYWQQAQCYLGWFYSYFPVLFNRCLNLHFIGIVDVSYQWWLFKIKKWKDEKEGKLCKNIDIYA